MSVSQREPRPPEDAQSFAETALRLGGKSDEEARRTGVLDKADELVETLFAPQYQTTASPAHRAVWDAAPPAELFASQSASTPPHVQQTMERSLEVVRRHRAAGTLCDAQGKIAEGVLSELGAAGYWGLLVDREHGGSGAPLTTFFPFLTQMSLLDPTVAGMASVHGCIGAVDPVRTFGTPEQKARLLPPLADGRRLSAFALTEPGAGSDLSALRTTARRDGDSFVVNGEKLFITNVIPGRTIGLVCLIEGKPAVLICDLPAAENEHFQLRRYGLYALKHTWNQGLIFRDFRVPAENLLQPVRGDGLTIAYHGLNLGRVALCATSAGGMRLMLAGMLPWARYRRTYGEAIARRELVRRRLARLAGLIVGADALVAWCAGLLERGYRGEMECIIAKIFGSEAQKEAAIELGMKTHGGRSFLHGHPLGDNLHEFLAPCIYEGEGEMLGMAFFKSLVKEHGTQYFEPVGKAFVGAGIRKPNLANPAHLWLVRGPLFRYAKWWLARKSSFFARANLPALPTELADHARFACRFLQRSAFDVSGVMRRYQLALPDRQCRMAELSQRVQDAIVILCTSLYAGRQSDPILRGAGDVLCQALRDKLTGRRPSDGYFRRLSRLGEQIAEQGFPGLEALGTDSILMPYEQ